MKELIQKLVEAFGPSGFEDAVRQLIRDEVAAHADEISVDAMGNLIVWKRGTGDGQTVMVAAHMDEIGLMATHITEDGFVRVTNLGGVSAHTLRGGRVRLADGLEGILFSDRLTDATKVLSLDKYFVDVGATSRDDCPVAVGTPMTFWRPFLAQGTRLTSKAMDDRIACAVAIETLRRLPATTHDVAFVFTVQEEVGVRGATAAANRIRPNIGIALDVTLTGDMPEARPMAVALGRGPAIKVKDSGMIAHPGLVQALRESAETNAIPYQLEVLTGGSTDARAMQIAGPGCAAGCISIPCRYVHTQSETVDSRDVDNTVALLVAFLSGPITL